jgi:hypothetical protein
MTDGDDEMTQVYSNPSRAADAHALPDVEVFYEDWRDGRLLPKREWFYWFCFPGCLPDSDPIGPFATRKEAVADAQSQGE